MLQEHQPGSGAPANDFLAPEDDPAEAVNWAREALPDDGDPERPEAPLPDRPRPVADPGWTERARAAAKALRRLGGAA